MRQVSLEGKPWGITSLYDAIDETARLVGERANKHRALLVITDGVDTGSKLTPPQVSGVASSIDVPVYLLTVVNPADHPGGEFQRVATDAKTSQTADAGRPRTLDRRRHALSRACPATLSRRCAIYSD